MKRLLLAVVLTLPLSGCLFVAGVPAAVVWTTAGAGLGYAASVNGLATEALKVWDARNPPDQGKPNDPGH